MARPINFDLLNKSELEYEVKIRLEEPSENVIKLKKQLRSLTVPSEDICDSPIPIEDDLFQIDVTLSYLENKVTQIESGDLKYLRKVETYLNHLYYRLERIDIDLQPSLRDTFDTLKAKHHTFEQKVETATFQPAEPNDLPPPSTNPLLQILPPPSTNPLQTLSLPSSSPPLQIPSAVQTFIPTVTPPSYNQVQVMVPDRSLNELKKFAYNGKTCPKSFIQKIEEFCMCRSIQKDRLVDQAFEIFTEDALHWFRFQRMKNPSLTWKELCNLLIKDFDNFDADYKLLSAIRNRTQGQNETIIVYVSIMYGMFSRLTKKLTEEEQLEIFLRNIRPCYSVFVALKDVTSVDSLITTCQNYEKFLDRDRNFKEPNSDINPSIAEFNYKPAITAKPSTNSNSNPIRPPNYNQPRNYSNHYASNAVALYPPQQNNFCVRCRTYGHSLPKCTQPRFLICFKCGLKGFKTSDCPKCNPSTSNTKN